MHTCLRSIIWCESLAIKLKRQRKNKNTNERTVFAHVHIEVEYFWISCAIRSAEYAQNSNKNVNESFLFSLAPFSSFQFSTAAHIMFHLAKCAGVSTASSASTPSYSRNESVSLFLEFFLTLFRVNSFSNFLKQIFVRHSFASPTKFSCLPR